ncbi:uncharacterized protein LOC659608 [Tribolium castaneum]|uniref:Uncharacterized protein n=1 Tax=Tribolium castaneum TaxID=7070 RepID=A0A139WHX0_TRICA|nr:PREDICTED: uncharacterized protein LOC659608 [Tribolium castaneum]XP_015835451.1 PREDICTED: uncharacterized protein LOC659608 [Tribolium castaneum]KYB27526.1 hypothetical protein TcasGA2_TC033001 [Tribolium castaneum]|eukprot:XP_008199339.1 PREDICTED: uncharacterized protein LOC659608 [Tribolium castaneum]
MKLFCLIFGVCLFGFGKCAEPPTTKAPTLQPPSSVNKPDDIPEDVRVLRETIEKYGPPHDYNQLGFPGPKVLLDDEKHLFKNKLDYEGAENYTLRVRTITEYFSYNGHFEEVRMPLNFTQNAQIKGQFATHFERKSGGFYIRTIGYKVDENGYRQFLLDLTVAQTTLKEVSQPSLSFCSSIGGIGGGPGGGGFPTSGTVGGYPGSSSVFGSAFGGGAGLGAPASGKVTISSTVLATLTGGNLG